MPDLLVRELPPELYDRLKRAAKAHGKSLAQEARDILTERLMPSKADRRAEVDRIRAMSPYSDIDSTALIREDRDNAEPYR